MLSMTKIFFFVLLVTERIDNEISKSCNTLTFINWWEWRYHYKILYIEYLIETIGNGASNFILSYPLTIIT